MSATSTPTPEQRRAAPETAEAPETDRRRRPFVVLAAVVGITVVLLRFMPLTSATEAAHLADETVTRAEIETTGSVEVVGGDRTAVTFRSEWTLAGRPSTRAWVEDGVLRLEGRCGPLPARLGRCDADVIATVPPAATVVARTSTGTIDVRGTDGGVDLGSSAGSIEVRDVAGPALLRSSAGGIRGELTGGEVDASTSAGGIELSITGPLDRLSATSSAGGIVLEVPDEVYRVDASTSTGAPDIRVRTDPDEHRLIHARSGAGGVVVKRIGR